MIEMQRQDNYHIPKFCLLTMGNYSKLFTVLCAEPAVLQVTKTAFLNLYEIVLTVGLFILDWIELI